MTTGSVTQKTTVQSTPLTAAITQVLTARAKDLGGFTVSRLLPVREQAKVGPWVFFDEMGPADFAAGTGINVRPHPHINLATVTYLFTGEILHRDSLGSYQPLQPGDLNLMVAGRGIVHSERERPEVQQQPHQLHGLQLWLALPEADEECEPAFLHYAAADLPHTQVNGVSVRVLIGEAYRLVSPVKQFFNTLYLEAQLPAGHHLTLPQAEERALYVVKGTVQLDGIKLQAQQLAVLEPQAELIVTAEQETLLVVIGGAKTSERFIEWNFVSSQQHRIAQAKADWLADRFDKIPGDDQEYIPLPGSQ